MNNKNNLTVLPDNDPNRLETGFVIYEEVGIAVINDYAIDSINSESSTSSPDVSSSSISSSPIQHSSSSSVSSSSSSSYLGQQGAAPVTPPIFENIRKYNEIYSEIKERFKILDL